MNLNLFLETTPLETTLFTILALIVSIGWKNLSVNDSCESVWRWFKSIISRFNATITLGAFTLPLVALFFLSGFFGSALLTTGIFLLLSCWLNLSKLIDVCESSWNFYKSIISRSSLTKTSVAITLPFLILLFMSSFFATAILATGILILSLCWLNIHTLADFFGLCWTTVKSVNYVYIPTNLDYTIKLANAIKEKGTLLTPQIGSVFVYKINQKVKQINIKGCESFVFGEEVLKINRTIMVSGATGAGKSTLINGMVNYILGVKWEDSYRFKLVHETHSQTSEVTVYKIHYQKGFKVDYSLTIVDTPGFGDARSVERDKEITEQLRQLFSDKDGIGEIDAVCFVAKASVTELTTTQKYVFDSILSIFGKDVAENIRILVTFADSQLPPVLEAVKASGVLCPKDKDGLPVHFKFNNSALFADNKSSEAGSMNGDENFDQIVWNMGTESMKSFFASLNQIKTIRLTMTNEVMKERQELESSVEDLQLQVKLGLAKFEEIKETSEKLQQNENEIRRNENFEFYVTVKKDTKEPIADPTKYVTNCQVCEVTCHFPCQIRDDNEKKGCWAMGNDGFCTQCPGKCFWNLHFNQPFRWVHEEFTERRTVKELKEKYEKATGQKLTLNELMTKLKAEYKRLQDEVVRLMEKAVNCLNRLKEIALERNPLSTPEYISMLIKGEQHEAKPGWEKRVQSLNKMKEHAELIAKVERGEELINNY